MARQAAAADTDFIGHPRGLAYLAFTEAWERFSYYGMTALVVLYMVQQLLLPSHVEQVAGLPTFRAVLESVFGPLSTAAFASQIFGLYTGFVYFTPLLGGAIADRWLGARTTVVIGALLMCAGHLAMAFDATFLMALLLLVLGSGCLKGNISAQVGQLYPGDDESMRTRGYAIFSMAINFGAVLGPLLCGSLAQIYGWHAGFGAAAALMLLAAMVYMAGARHLPPELPRRDMTGGAVPLTPAERRTMLLLGVVMLVTVFQSVAYNQFFDVGILWVDAHADMVTPIGQVPTPWFNSIDAFFSIIAVPPLFALWRWQARRGREPGDIGKIGLGAAICAASCALMTLSAALAGAGRTSVMLPFLAFALVGIAFLFYWPTFLALVSRTAPAQVNATLMGTAFLSLFLSNLLVGWIGGFYEPLGPVRFWLLQTGIAATGALIVLVIGHPLARALEPAGD